MICTLACEQTTFHTVRKYMTMQIIEYETHTYVSNTYMGLMPFNVFQSCT